MPDGFAELDATLEAAWRQLDRGVADAAAAARHPTLATVGRDGAPEVRTVVLRAADRGAACLEFHSDAAAHKIAQLHAEPRVGLHIWDPHARLQLRLRGTASILTGAAVVARWRALPASARTNYGGAPRPGTPIDDPGAHAARIDPARFAVVRCTLGEIETLHLGADRHRRARFRADADWRGSWLAP